MNHRKEKNLRTQKKIFQEWIWIFSKKFGEREKMKEILPNLDREGGLPMYMQLYQYIKREIERGNILQGEKLPSIRMLSKKIGISVTTIRLAYDQLSMEGYVLNKEKSGYFVNQIDFIEEMRNHEMEAEILEKKDLSRKQLLAYDEECFDFVKWKKCINHVLTYDSKTLLAEADVQGEPELREQIAKYVFQSRGVHCVSDEVVVGAGTQQLISILAAILRRCELQVIGFENPGYFLSQHIFSEQKFETVHLHVDSEGVLLNPLMAKRLDLLYVSPSHQFPTGIVMSARRRTQLLAWARDRSGYLIEDDYDSELRYYGRPIPALKAMDKNQRVIYIGSFSSTLLPSIRISYLVLPRELLAIYHQLKHSYSQGVSKVDQLTLCKFMKDGHYQRHIRRIRRLYSEKASRLSELIQKKYRGKIEIVSNTSGLFLIARFESERTEQELAKLFVDAGIKATPYGSYVKTAYEQVRPGLLVYFYNIELQRMEELLQKIFDKAVG